MKGYSNYLILLGLLFTVFVAVEYLRPKPLDWSATFINKDKIPYGTYVLFQRLHDLFPGQPVQVVREPVVQALNDSTAAVGNFIFINPEFDLDTLNQQTLLDFVNRGNQVFIAAESYTYSFSEQLGFSVEYTEFPDSVEAGIYFTNPSLNKGESFTTFQEGNIDWYFIIEQQKGQLALGKNTAGEPNFIKVPYGQGAFYLSTVPYAFTNYNTIHSGRSAYAATALSYLPVQPLLWDEYQKQGSLGEQSIFRVFMSNEALKWAYYIALFALLLFVLFESKRTQRIIPVLEVPKNTTLEFVRVVGSLYFNHRNHKLIAEKKIAYFLEYLRLHFYEQTGTLDDELMERVWLKSGVPQELVTDIFQLIHLTRVSDTLNEYDLLQLNKKLEAFYNQTSARTLVRR